MSAEVQCPYLTPSKCIAACLLFQLFFIERRIFSIALYILYDPMFVRYMHNYRLLLYRNV